MRVQYHKYPETPHWRHDPMRVLGEDEHGLWLGGDASTWLQKGEVEEPKTRHERGFFCSSPFVQLIVPDAWWTLIFNGDSRDLTHYIDIVTPAQVTGDAVTFVDLDLDVARRQNGSVYIDDEDEFLVHQKTLGYPPQWIDAARASAARLVLSLERMDEPFDAAARAWRARLMDGADQ